MFVFVLALAFSLMLVAVAPMLTAISVMLAVSFTVTMLAVSDFRMGGPTVKVLACRR